MIRIVGLRQHYGVRPVLRDVSLDVPQGELAAVMGPNGMGKSTLMGAAAGVLAPQRGYVEFGGLRRRRSEEEEYEIRRRTYYLPDHPWLPMGLTGREFLLRVGRLYEVEGERLMVHAERLLVLFDLERVGDSPIRSYSNGQQKKIAICAALIAETPYLLLDEPFTGGLDPSAVVALKKVLARLAARQDVTILMATQLADIAEAVAHRVCVIVDGSIKTYDTVDNIRGQTGQDRLETALEKLVHHETLERIDAYFEGR